MFEVAHGSSLPPVPSSMSQQMHDFVSLCLQVALFDVYRVTLTILFQRDPAKRPNAAALTKHPWLLAV
jgi:hypothetical protein